MYIQLMLSRAGDHGSFQMMDSRLLQRRWTELNEWHHMLLRLQLFLQKRGCNLSHCRLNYPKTCWIAWAQLSQETMMACMEEFET